MLLKTLRYFNDVALKKRKLYKEKKKKTIGSKQFSRCRL